MSSAPNPLDLDDGDWTREPTADERLDRIEARLDGIEEALREARWERWALAAGLLVLLARAFGTI